MRHSFEIMPPRNPAAAPKFWAACQELVATRPDFISVTYGASGSDKQTAQAVASKIVQDEPIMPLAHLTCIQTNLRDLEEIAADFLNDGVRMFLALRGDPPRASADPALQAYQPAPTDIQCASDLVRTLRRLDAEHKARDLGHAFTSIARPLVIAVATFPGGNAQAGTTADQEIDRLLEKQAAGADFALCQIYYDPKIYDDFVSKARKRGVVIPIVSAVAPSFHPLRYAKIERNIGVAQPSELVRALSQTEEPQKREEISTAFWQKITAAALDSGSPGVHIYTFNNVAPATALLQAL